MPIRDEATSGLRRRPGWGDQSSSDPAASASHPLIRRRPASRSVEPARRTG